MGKIRSLQVVRFVAALGVVWEHAATRADPHRLTGGSAGVDLFFVLSGYVISMAAQARPGKFLQDRLARIFPIYWLWTLVWLVAAIGIEPFDGWRLFTTVTLLPSPTSSPLWSYVGVGWTLSFEIVFYAAVWIVLRGLDWRFLVAAYAALAVAAIFFDPGPLHFFGSPMAVEFLLGVVAFHLGRGRPIAGAFGLALACAVFPLLPRYISLPQAALEPLFGLGRVVMLGPLALLAVWSAAQFDCRSRLWAPLVLLGDASYSIYLSHLVLMDNVPRLVGHFLSPALATAGALVVGLGSYLAVERPLLRLARRALSPSGRDQADPAAVGPVDAAQHLEADPGDARLRRA